MRIPGAGGPHGFGVGAAARLVGVEFAAALAEFGWSDRWSDLLAAFPGSRPGRVVRHDGTALHLATTDGVIVMPMTRRLDPAPTVGDWMACVGNEPVAVLPRLAVVRGPGRRPVARGQRRSRVARLRAGPPREGRPDLTRRRSRSRRGRDPRRGAHEGRAGSDGRPRARGSGRRAARHRGARHLREGGARARRLARPGPRSDRDHAG